MHFAGRPRNDLGKRVVLNLARDDVREYVFDWLDQLVTVNDIALLKWDYNLNFSEPGWPDVSPAEQKNLWVRYVQNLYAILDRLRKKHSALEIESCSGGGGRVDLGILLRAEQVWPSDNTEAFDRLGIQQGFTYAYTPHIMMDWVTDVPNFNGRSVPIQYRFLVAMQGALGIGADLNRWQQADLALAKQMVNNYKSIRETVQNGALYRLASLNAGNFIANQYISADKSQAVLFAFLHSQQFGRKVPPIVLRDLDEKAIYTLSRLDGKRDANNSAFPKKLSGAYLMRHGLTLPLQGDYDSSAIKLDRNSTQ
jgi:alpha-galactosidase